MIMLDKCKQHVDSCRFCWMCHHICPVGNATGQERNTARARALGISLVNRGAIDLSEVVDNVYECATCGACVHDCTTGWDPVMFTKETRLQAALDGKLPDYIAVLVDNCLTAGNAYGKTELSAELAVAIAAHSKKTDTLLYLGVDAMYMAPELAIKAIRVLEKAGVDFTVLADEPASGAQLDFLIGAAQEAKDQMAKAAAVINEYETIVVYEPVDAKLIMRTYKEYNIGVSAKVQTYTTYLADLVASGKLTGKKVDKVVTIQDPYALARDLGETQPVRDVVGHFATLQEMLLHGAETVWAGDILMAQYVPNVIQKVSCRRINNAVSLGYTAMVAVGAAEYTALKNAEQSQVEILCLEDLIL